MFSGGGFIGQMFQTNKQNRELLKKNKRKPFEKQDYELKDKLPLIEIKTLSDADRTNMLKDLAIERRRDNRKKLIILLVSIVSAIILIAMIKDKVFRFFIETF